MQILESETESVMLHTLLLLTWTTFNYNIINPQFPPKTGLENS